MHRFSFFASLPDDAVHLLSAVCFTSESLNENMNTTSGAVSMSCAERVGFGPSVSGLSAGLLSAGLASVSGLSASASLLSAGLASSAFVAGASALSAGFALSGGGADPPQAISKSNGKHAPNFDMSRQIAQR